MRDITSPWKFMVYAMGQAVRHPRSRITYLHCETCRIRLNVNDKKCPVCKAKKPNIRQISPMPWYGSLLCMVFGVLCWCLGAGLNIPGLDEAGRAMVYIPQGTLFGMSVPR